LLIDVDLFKSYNDIYGHIGGDTCLRCIARMIADTLQRHSDVAARFGGEEFAVILPDMQLEAALRVAESIRKAVVTMNLPHSGNPEGVQTISIGVAAGTPGENASVVSLLIASDHALYRAKYLGRNRVEGATVAMPQPEMSAQD
jgi:diguanylate cyclase (GGDEF)-like protein